MNLKKNDATTIFAFLFIMIATGLIVYTFVVVEVATCTSNPEIYSANKMMEELTLYHQLINSNITFNLSKIVILLYEENNSIAIKTKTIELKNKK